ncbi:hypothetical protein PTI98_013536 [Pleurotus ostreatus]|nr:hypothetical protein PTI98_013536 [Pleurotus ostreatus]
MPVPSHGLSPSTPASYLEAVVLAANDHRHIPIIEGECGLSDFDYLWIRGLPFVCRDGVRPDGKWSSDYLAACFGPDSCTLVDCEEPYGTREDIVDSFLRSMSTSGPNVWKLKDYPTDTSFKLKAPIPARAFQRALPVREYTSEYGRLNITNFFPANYTCIPDLGPKLYAAMTSRQNGSTRLHIDISDAVNIMVDDGKALWHIFSSEHLEILKEFIISELRDEKQQSFSRIDSISSYHVYLTDEHLETLKARYNVRPFTFEQHHRDVVFIPAGCAHQVSNITPCAKIAMDFLAPQSLQRCIKVDRNLRTCRQTNKDTLELSLLLFHCWMALSVFKMQLNQAGETDITDSALSNPANSAPNPHSDFRSAVLNVLSEVQPPVVTPAPYVGTLPLSANLYSQPHIIPYPYTVHPHTYAPSSSGFQPTPAASVGSFASVFSVTPHAGSASIQLVMAM